MRRFLYIRCYDSFELLATLKVSGIIELLISWSFSFIWDEYHITFWEWIVVPFVFHTIRYMAVYLGTSKHDSVPSMQTMNYQLQKEKEMHGVAVQLLIIDRFFLKTKFESLLGFSDPFDCKNWFTNALWTFPAHFYDFNVSFERERGGRQIKKKKRYHVHNTNCFCSHVTGCKCYFIVL